MTKHEFLPHHINATKEDLEGNDGIGRYIFLPGSDGRAKEIANHFDHLTVKPHSRGHNLYLGAIKNGKKSIDVAAVSTGMGCPSMEIILHELFHLGGKRFLRIGTAGSLQHYVKLGDFVNAQASVRDEHTTTDYVPITIPAVASFRMVHAIQQAADHLKLSHRFHTGVVHCKNSLYAREFGAGPKGEKNKAYLNLLVQCGVLATEMETAALFIQSELYNYQLKQQGTGPSHEVLAGAILAAIAVLPGEFTSHDKEVAIVKELVQLALETIKVISSQE